MIKVQHQGVGSSRSHKKSDQGAVKRSSKRIMAQQQRVGSRSRIKAQQQGVGSWSIH